jgi:hypothetical protein
MIADVFGFMPHFDRRGAHAVGTALANARLHEARLMS